MSTANIKLDKRLLDKVYVTDCTDAEKRCSGCGSCCSNLLPLAPGEKKRIKRYIKAHNIKDSAGKTSAWIGNKINDGLLCPFRDNLHHCCTIYAVRPAICRRYMCSKSSAEIIVDREKAHDDAGWVETDLRATFFGGPSVLSAMYGMAPDVTQIRLIRE